MKKTANTHFDVQAMPPGPIHPDQTAEVEIQATLHKITAAMAIPENNGLTPDPAIRHTVHRRMETRRSVQINFLCTAYQYVLDLFACKIPLYQAAVGVVTVCALLFVTDRFLQSPRPSDTGFAEPFQAIQPLTDTSTVLSSLRKRTPQPAEEDSLVKHRTGVADSFFTSALDSL